MSCVCQDVSKKRSGARDQSIPFALSLSKGVSREALNKSFDKLRTNGNLLIPFVVSLSNHERNQLVQRFPKDVRTRLGRAEPAGAPCRMSDSVERSVGFATSGQFAAGSTGAA